jgi:hypothetical protein
VRYIPAVQYTKASILGRVCGRSFNKEPFSSSDHQKVNKNSGTSLLHCITITTNYWQQYFARKRNGIGPVAAKTPFVRFYNHIKTDDGLLRNERTNERIINDAYKLKQIFLKGFFVTYVFDRLILARWMHSFLSMPVTDDRRQRTDDSLH